MSESQIGSSQAPGSNPLSIGAVIFNSSETPTRLPIGVEQMVVSQTLVGGSRVVQTFGVSPKNISWSGHLYGEYVQARVQQMRLYVSSGNPVLMSWKKSTYVATGNALQNPQASTPLSQIKEKYTVIVKDFTPEFFAQYAEYSIELVIVQANNGAYNSSSPNSINAQIAALLTTANKYTAQLQAADNAATIKIAQAMNVVNSNITAATPISQNPLSGPGIQQSIQVSQNNIASYQSSIGNTSENFIIATQLSGALTAISRNVAAGYSPQSITVQGGNAFTTAAQHYGDVSQAFTLSSIAGLPSPFLPSGSFTNILLPNLQVTRQTNGSTK